MGMVNLFKFNMGFAFKVPIGIYSFGGSIISSYFSKFFPKILGCFVSKSLSLILEFKGLY